MIKGAKAYVDFQKSCIPMWLWKWITWGLKIEMLNVLEKSLKWPCFWVLPLLLTPYFNLKHYYQLSQGILLNQGWNLVPQYLMHEIQNNYGNNKQKNSEDI